MKNFIAICFTSLLFFSNLAIADPINIENAYVRATPPHTTNSAAFMVIENTSSRDIKLVAVSSDIAERVELHQHVHQDGMMKMRQVDAIRIEKDQQVSLQPGGYHVMFMGLKQALKDGEMVQLSLYFDNGEEITIEVPIKKINK
ncbi:MAG: copper chaperone PCu(A)C [Psychromonas sp.]